MSKECLIQFEKFGSVALAGQLIGRKVIWKKETAYMPERLLGCMERKAWFALDSLAEFQVKH